jgi:LysR family glycine cleavage system transcriptional activator
MRALPPLTALRAFDAAGRHLSFQKAAEELGLTPTAISHQIRLLEEYCGQQLFQRRPRPLALTAQGGLLLTAVSAGLDSLADGIRGVRTSSDVRLRVTATNAFAARGLMPRLPAWRAAQPGIGLDIMGTDQVMNLAAGEVDVAIRYARKPPRDLQSTEIAVDQYLVVASPALVGTGGSSLDPTELLQFPLIDGQWPKGSPNPPMWFEWQRIARQHYSAVPDMTGSVALSFGEDLHGIDAAIAGHGVAICSDVLIADALAAGTLVQVSPVVLEGYRFFAVHRAGHPKARIIGVFEAWIAAQFRQARG